MQTSRQLHDEYNELRQRLANIQQRTIRAHPESNKQEEDLQALIISKISSRTGVNAEEEMGSIRKIEQKLRDRDVPDSERQKLMKDYEKRVQVFRGAQIQVMQAPEVQQAQAVLTEATNAAMKQVDPQTELLMEQMQQKQVELLRLRESGAQAK